jgi:hypothetical protein
MDNFTRKDVPKIAKDKSRRKESWLPNILIQHVLKWKVGGEVNIILTYNGDKR